MSAQSLAKQWLDIGLGFIYPNACQICGNERATAIEGYVCPACSRKAHFIVPPYCERCGLPYEGEITATFQCSNCRDMDLHFRFARSAVMARDMVLEMIHRYKYQQALWFEPLLAGLLTRQAGPELAHERWDLIIPVPLHAARRRERGFNQAERLARCLSHATRIPMDARLLRRTEPTPTQTRLSRAERAKNVERAFTIRPGQKLAAGTRAVLVDDVFTTGATTSACARALRHAGASDVCVWTLARGGL